MTTQAFELEHIETVPEVISFFYYLIAERKVVLHLDDNFADYVDADGRPAFTAEEVSHYNDLMAEAFYACGKINVDVYAVALDVMRDVMSGN